MIEKGKSENDRDFEKNILVVYSKSLLSPQPIWTGFMDVRVENWYILS